MDTIELRRKQRPRVVDDEIEVLINREDLCRLVAEVERPFVEHPWRKTAGSRAGNDVGVWSRSGYNGLPLTAESVLF